MRLIALPEKQVWETLFTVTQASSVMMSLPSSTNGTCTKKYPLYIGDAGLTTAKMHLVFWQLQLLPELQLLTRIVPCGSQLWQYNTHGVHEQLKLLLQGLGSLVRHKISAIHNKGHCSPAKIFVMWTAVLIPICDLFNHNEWLPWLQTTWRDSGSGWFTLGLETNCTKQLERKLVQIILQELQP